MTRDFWLNVMEWTGAVLGTIFKDTFHFPDGASEDQSPTPPTANQDINLQSAPIHIKACSKKIFYKFYVETCNDDIEFFEIFETI